MYNFLSAISIVLAMMSTQLFAQPTIIEPEIPTNRKGFAILIDEATYSQTKDAVIAYKRAVEADGLPTYIVYDRFNSPEDVKRHIYELFKKPGSLEGVVFIGEIPIVKVRNAQHMTTAFKMDEDGFPIRQSSVPTDRFYDDFNLKFDYLHIDEEDPLVHYYKLREDSPQQLAPTIYSARIRYPKERGGNAFEEIRNYLIKVVNTKRSNVLDHMTAFTGEAYNSECLVAWRDDIKAYREDFPFVGTSNEHFRQLNFRTTTGMKHVLFEEMQRKNVDILLMRKHGTPTQELISRAPEANTIDGTVTTLKRYLFGRLRRVAAAKQNVDSMKLVFANAFGLTDNFFEDWDSEESRKKDSLVSSEDYINTKDLRPLSINPLFVILDACYNGSFDEPDYIAGNYIFSKGNTVAAQGNTRNVLQDTWSMNYMGLLSYGVRLGWVHNLNPTLENHLIGDPTFHFGNPGKYDLNQALSTGGDDKYWRTLLASEDPIYQSIALRMLADRKQISSSDLYDWFEKSTYHTVRLQALYLLSKAGGPNFIKAIANGLSDPYEMIARQASIFAKKNGHESLIPAIASSYVNGIDRQRVIFNLQSSFRVFDMEKIQRALEQALVSTGRVNLDQDLENVRNQSAREKSQIDRSHENLMNASVDLQKRVSEARSIRNSNYHLRIDDYLKLIANPNEPEALRISLAEALGWFNYSSRKAEIISSLKNLQNEKNLPRELAGEIQQTLNRLQ